MRNLDLLDVCNVRLLPSDTRSKLFTGANYKVLHHTSNSMCYEEFRRYQHLYVTLPYSDIRQSHIRENNYFIELASNTIYQWKLKIPFPVEESHKYERILSSTDEKLSIVILQDIVLDSYVSLYNKGHIVTSAALNDTLYGFTSNVPNNDGICEKCNCLKRCIDEPLCNTDIPKQTLFTLKDVHKIAHATYLLHQRDVKYRNKPRDSKEVSLWINKYISCIFNNLKQ
jgi:hypothetical protein